MCRASPSAESQSKHVKGEEVMHVDLVLWFYMVINESRADDAHAEIWTADTTKVS